MKKLKVALIGAGQIARVSHIRNYQSFEEVEVVAICDVNIQAAKEVAEMFGIPKYFESHKEMLATCKPDAVSVCVPNKFHCEMTIDALNANAHVYCEKPPAMTVEEAIHMEEVAKKQNKILTYGFHFRHSENVEFLKNKIQNGDFGEIYTAKVQWVRRRGIPGWGNFTNKQMQGGGPLIDIGAHMLDIALYLMDYPEVDYVCATAYDKIGKQGGSGLLGDWSIEKFTVEDGLFGFIKFKNGACIQLETTYALHMKEKDIRNVSLFGEKMGATLFPMETFSVDGERLQNQLYPFSKEEDLHFKGIENFIEAILGKSNIRITPMQGIRVQEIACACYASAQTGKPVLMEKSR